MTRRRGSAYTEGELNRLIDSVLHPFMKGEGKIPIMLLDAVAHSLIEQDPQKSFKKFMRFTLPELVNEAYLRGGKRSRSRSG
jgi:hypothetical protein